jgi:hypothetical protein
MQVDDSAEGEAGLELGRTAGKNVVGTLLRGAESRSPERCLADADRTLEEEAPRARRDASHEVANRYELGFSSDHPRWPHVPSPRPSEEYLPVLSIWEGRSSASLGAWKAPRARFTVQLP